jgi:hypothetical protein
MKVNMNKNNRLRQITQMENAPANTPLPEVSNQSTTAAGTAGRSSGSRRWLRRHGRQRTLWNAFRSRLDFITLYVFLSLDTHIDERSSSRDCLPLSSYTGESVFFLALLLAFVCLFFLCCWHCIFIYGFGAIRILSHGVFSECIINHAIIRLLDVGFGYVIVCSTRVISHENGYWLQAYVSLT